MWQFAAICQFLNIFYKSIGLESAIATEDLEKYLQQTCIDKPFMELHMKLLKLASGNRHINMDTWQSIFRSFVSHDDDIKSYFRPGDYAKFPIENKVILLHFLCEQVLGKPSQLFIKTANDPMTLRMEPLGTDAKGATFWLFDDRRLYKEIPLKPKKQDTACTEEGMQESLIQESSDVKYKWELVCSCRDDFMDLIQKFEKSKHPQEKQLFKALNSKRVAKMMADLRGQERKRRLKDALEHRKKSSRLLSLESEKLEKERMERQRRASEQESQMSQEENNAKENHCRVESRMSRAKERDARLFDIFEKEQMQLLLNENTNKRTRSSSRTSTFSEKSSIDTPSNVEGVKRLRQVDLYYLMIRC